MVEHAAGPGGQEAGGAAAVEGERVWGAWGVAFGAEHPL